MRHNLLPWIEGLWIAFVSIWALAAIRTKPTVRRISGWPRFAEMVLVILGIVLMVSRRLGFGWLGSRFLPDSAVIGWTGVAMTAGGIAFAVWARFVLGQNWSSEVTLKQGHELVRDGPYKWVRHPIYSGALLALLGTAVSFNEVRGLIAFGFFFAGWWLKARTEEALMIEQFGEQYRRYRREVKALIPFVL